MISLLIFISITTVQLIGCFKNYGKTPAYIVKMYKEKEMAHMMETERKRAVKPPLRYLPEAERNELMTVRARLIGLKYIFFILFSCYTLPHSIAWRSQRGANGQ